MITADQLKDVMDRADALHHYLNIDQKKVEFEEEQLRTQAPDFWEDPTLLKYLPSKNCPICRNFDFSHLATNRLILAFMRFRILSRLLV